MADTPADIIRVFDTPANLAANLKEKMIGGDTAGNRFAAKFPSIGMKYVSNDDLQALLAKANAFTGLNTFAALTTFNENITLNSNKKFYVNNDTTGTEINQDSGLSDDLKVYNKSASGGMDFETDSGDIVFQPANTEVMRLDANELIMAAGKEIAVAASVSGNAGLSYPPGTAPAAPVDGDWWNETDWVYHRINSSSVRFGKLVSWTATLTGVSAGPITTPAEYQIFGQFARVLIYAQSGASNLTTFTITGIPAVLEVPTTQYFIGQGTDNTAKQALSFSIITGVSPAITLSHGLDWVNGSGWTASGTKGFDSLTFLIRIV